MTHDSALHVKVGHLNNQYISGFLGKTTPANKTYRLAEEALHEVTKHVTITACVVYLSIIGLIQLDLITVLW